MNASEMLERGLRLAPHKERPFERPLRTLPPPRSAVVALDQGSGREAHPLVGPGMAVRLGSRIAAGRDTAADLHSPVSGVVREITLAPTPRGRGRCIVIDSDDRDEREPGLQPLRDDSVEADTLLARIEAAGIAGLGGAAFPTATKLALARAAQAGLLVLNGAECEPWICCDDALMRERAGAVLRGAQLMLAACGASRALIAIEDDKPEALRALEGALAIAADPRLEVQVLPARFPLGAEGPLIAAVTGREVPLGGLPPDVGVLCQNVGTAAAVAALAGDGLPLVSRIVTVTGSGVREPANVEARIGTPIAELVAACGGYSGSPARLVAGGSLTGRALDSDAAPVTKGLNCVLVATAEDLPARPAELPCIRCGDCASVCPAGLLPQQLHVAVRADDAGALVRFGLAACIECGCCDWVCPSAIPLTARFRAARERQHLRDDERRRALEARARYERHERRLVEQAEAERRAFEDARRRARGSAADRG